MDVTSWRPSWQTLLVERILANITTVPGTIDAFKTRIVFQTPESLHHAVHIMQMGHVMLEPFPVTGDYQPALEALSIGLPVVTMPSQSHVGGRFALALYHMLGYGYQPFDSTASPAASTTETGSTSTNRASEHHVDGETGDAGSASSEPLASYSPLVVDSVDEYVNLAIRLTHQPKLRQFHSERILSRRHRLFQQDQHAVLAQWRLFVHTAMLAAKERSKVESPTQQALSGAEENFFPPDVLEIPVDLSPPSKLTEYTAKSIESTNGEKLRQEL